MTEPQIGSIQLDRTVESILVGTRHRADLGDIDALAASIGRDGLLQPLTITIDGVLVCGARRLAAIKKLGWRTVNVWVRSGLSDRLGQLLAEQDDNMLHKPYTQLEAAGLYREIKQVMAEDAARRKSATQFSSENQPGNDGPAKFAGPSSALGDAREQAAAMIPGGASHTTLEKIGYLEDIANNPTQPETLRAEAAAGLERIEAGDPVHPIYQAIRDADTTERERREAELHARAEAAVARAKSIKKGKRTPPRPLPLVTDTGKPVRYPLRAFIQTWGELTNWWTHYDADTLAAELTDEQFENFLTTTDGTLRFADALRAAREGTAERPRLRALCPQAWVPGVHLLGMSPAPTDPRNRRRLVALIAAGIVLLLLAGVGVYGLLTGPRSNTSTDPDLEPGPVTTAPPTVAPSTPRPPRVPAVPRSANPETFAQGVASTLFTWDTASGLWPLDYTSAILAVGDPSGDEQAGLASDVAAYLPTRDAWIELRQYATRQHLTIEAAYVPDAWADAVVQAQPGQLAAGTTAVTIEGTRQRAGVWNGQPVTSEHPVAFTVFVVCAPTYPTCHLLRLSQLDNPLR